MNRRTSGLIYAFTAYGFWGILPVYWKLIQGVVSIEILSNRILWSFLLLAILISATRQWGEIRKILGRSQELPRIFAASLLIAVNWGLYIWAVNAGRILDASLGYYINPLIAVALGVAVYKEKLDRLTLTALLLAAIGVLVRTVEYGQIPWVSLGLAVSFGLYGAIKKSFTTNSIVGLTIETAFLAPFALFLILFRHSDGSGAYLQGDPVLILLLAGSGIVTAIPLLLFASSAKRLRLSELGFIQYISPSINLVLGIFLYHETISPYGIAGFAIIWAALILYSVSQSRRRIR